MCSPLVASCQRKTWQYFFSRCISYTIIGFFAGSVGALLFKEFLDLSAKKLALIIVIICLGQIFFILKSNSNKPNIFATRFINTINQYSPLSQSATLGIITALLPCGFLYSAILMCAAFTNPLLSALGMFTFAVATSPVLLGSKWIVNYLSKKSVNLYKYFAIILLLLIALLAVIRAGYFKSNKATSPTAAEQTDCH